MIRRGMAYRWILAAALLLLLLGLGCGLAETTGETVTGYFVDHNYLRPRMEQTTDYVDVIPPYTIVTLDVIDGTWSLYTSPKGKTGYIYSLYEKAPFVYGAVENTSFRGPAQARPRTFSDLLFFLTGCLI